MAAGVWKISKTESQTVYLNSGPAQGPLVVYRIHNDGPEKVFAGNFAKGEEVVRRFLLGLTATYLDLQLQSAL